MSKQKYMELAEKLPYQYIKDSPTVKYYTDWRKYDKALILPKPTRTLKPPIKIAEKANIILGASSWETRNLPEKVSVEELGDDYEPGFNVESRIQAIHFARLEKPVKITIEPYTVLDEPVVIESHGGDGFLAHHIVLDVGANSDVKIVLVEYASSNGGESVKTFMVEGRITENSNVSIYTLPLHRGAACYHYKRLRLGENSRIESRILGLAGLMSHFREDYELDGSNSGVEVYGSIVAGNGRIDSITNIVHQAPRTKSLVLIRGVVLGKGLLVHRGVARVTPRAQWSSTSIDSHVSVLSEEGKGYSVPMLEIQTGRVLEARHSTAVTSIEEDQLFYMQSRGLSKRDAEKILVESIIGYSGLLERLELSLDEILTIVY